MAMIYVSSMVIMMHDDQCISINIIGISQVRTYFGCTHNSIKFYIAINIWSYTVAFTVWKKV